MKASEMVTLNTNVSSLNAQQSLAQAQKALTETMVQLSTGKRINAAQDDAASLAISQSMVGQILAVNQSVRNLNDATNMMQIADTGLSSLQDMFLRINELAVQGRNDSLTGSQKMNIVTELSSINQEINNVIDRTKMNGNGLLTNYGVLNAGSGLQQNSTNVGILDDTLASTINVLGARPGIYKFSNVGADLTLTKTDNNDNTLWAQTLTVQTPVGAKNTDVLQTLNYSELGISITLKSRTKPNNVNNLTDSGDEIAHKLSNIFKPMIIDEAVKLNFGAGATNDLLVSFRPINLTTVAKPDLEIDAATQNLNGASNTNPTAIQVLPASTTAKGAYSISISQSAAATEFELVGFTGTGATGALNTSNSIGINSGFNLTVGTRTYIASSGTTPLSGSNGQLVSINEFTNWINGLNDQNISARLYQRDTGDYSIKVDGGSTGAANAVSFTNLNLAVGFDQLPGTKIYGNVSLAADGKLSTSFPSYLSGAVDPTSGNAVTTSATTFNGYEGNNSQYLSLSGQNYSSLYANTTASANGIQINNELGPIPAYNPNYYPYPNAYNNAYDPGSVKYVGAGLVPGGWSQSSTPPASWYVTHWDRNYTYAYDATYNPLSGSYNSIRGTTRDQPSSAAYVRDTSTYTYNATSWDNNFTSNTYLLNSVISIDPARDAKLTITKDGVSRNISNDTNVFTDATSGIQINLTPGLQPWDGGAAATIVVGDPQPALPRNNSNLVAVDEKITAMNSFSTNTSKTDWKDAFDYLQDQANKALDYLSYERSIIGGQMNQVAYINTNLRSQSVNLEKSNSDLLDTDVASASAKLAKGEIQQRVAAQMITQANSLVNPIRTLINLWDDIKSK
ncbi:flagellin [Polynucleobacter sp. UB-Piko-W3]|uniref:flagellin N-terminal helical domain-containing protein n=1 Tax=Polynucleobacter sp. UB-Piko-W3 TaxID=1819735 RepID=UPI001C0E2549|nr:flagellin [Polynucleobacter sp. UB-Piko-W3]